MAKKRKPKPKPKLALGPLLYPWAAESWRDFYFRIADEAEIETVHLGEVVCWKRHGIAARHIEAVRARLVAAGKEVVLSTLALIMNDAEMESVRALADQDDLLVEANDMAACALLDGRPHMLGPTINVYNEGTLAALAARGAVRACLPAELPATALRALADSPPAELEVQVFGRFPLALSARCYAARARGLSKDACKLVCTEDAGGLPVETLDGDPFLAVNGTQTLSGACGNLIAEVGVLADMGIARFRLSPEEADMVAIAAVFRAVADGAMEVEEGDAKLAELAPEVPFANGFFHGAEGAAFLAEAE
jgi:collagenase-like PrtC family protease